MFEFFYLAIAYFFRDFFHLILVAVILPLVTCIRTYRYFAHVCEHKFSFIELKFVAYIEINVTVC